MAYCNGGARATCCFGLLLGLAGCVFVVVQIARTGKHVLDPAWLVEGKTTFELQCNHSDDFTSIDMVGLFTDGTDCNTTFKGISVTFMNASTAYPKNVVLNSTCGVLPETPFSEEEVVQARRLSKKFTDVELVANFTFYNTNGTCIPGKYNITSKEGALWAVNMDDEVKKVAKSLLKIAAAAALGWVLTCAGCLCCVVGFCVWCVSARPPEARQFQQYP
jgi:hypothetical protein